MFTINIAKAKGLETMVGRSHKNRKNSFTYEPLYFNSYCYNMAVFECNTKCIPVHKVHLFYKRILSIKYNEIENAKDDNKYYKKIRI